MSLRLHLSSTCSNYHQAGGQIGKFITEHLLKNGKHQLTAITREGSPNKIPDGVAVKHVDYDSHESLIAALKGQDCLIITLSVFAPQDQQGKLIKAAADAGVPWIVPNEYGSDGTNEQVNKDIRIGVRKKEARDLIEKLGVSSWLGIACMFWYEYSLAGGPARYGFDLRNQSVVFFDEGTTRLDTSTWPQCGRAVANLLALKLLPEDENDESPTLSQYRNKYARISSFNLNQKEMLESLMRVTGTKESDWKITHEPVKERYESGKAELQQGNRSGFAKMLYSRIFFPDSPGDFQAKGGIDNEKLRLPKEDLDEFTKIAVQMSKDGAVA